MPLDIQPLSATRRAVTAIVLLALFIASLGVAQGVIAYKSRHGGHIASGNRFNIAFPRGFEAVPRDTPIAQEAAVALHGTVDGAPRYFYLFRFASDLPDNLDESAIYQEIARAALPVYQRYIPAASAAQMATSVFGDEPAIDFSGPFANRTGFARMRAILIGKQMVVLLYIGGTRFSPQDEANWNGAAGI